MNNTNNKPKNVVITGSASGIGKYIAQEYALDKNYNIFCFDINKTDVVSTAKNINVDLRIEEQVKQCFSEIESIDLAINCAGVSSLRKNILDFSQTEIIESWADNFLPAFNAMKNEIIIMQRQNYGKIINIASITGHIGMKNFLAYSTAKASIINMTKVAAIEQAKNNIQINSISPATIDTPMIRKKYNGEIRDYSDVYYTNDCGHVSDIYSVVKMLENNEFMTGNDIKLDGGITQLFTI